MTSTPAPIGTVVEHMTRSLDDDAPDMITTYDAISLPPIFVPSEPTATQRMLIVEASGTLDFWNDPEEDVYKSDDGQDV